MKKLFVILLAITVVAFTAPTMAAEWETSMNVKFETWAISETANDDPDGIAVGGDGNYDDDADEDTTEWGLGEYCDFTIAGSAGDLSGVMTIQLPYGDESSTQIVVYTGSWNFGAGTFTIGHDYTAINMFYSTQVSYADNCLVTTGGIYNGRRDFMGVSFGGFNIQLVEPSPDLHTAGVDVTGVGVDWTVPRLEVEYMGTFGPVTLEGVGVYQTYEIEYGSDSYTVNSYMLGVGAEATFGPVTIRGMVNYAQNAGALGIFTENDNFAAYDATDDEIDDNTQVGLMGSASFMINDMVTLAAGAGQFTNSMDNWDNDDTSIGAYGNVVITLAPGVTVTPEIFWVDQQQDENDVDEQTITYVGAQWVISL
jgi:hypothetical protein